MRHSIPARLVALLFVLALAAAVWRFWPRTPTLPAGEIRASGTIEATEVVISPKVSGRILSLAVDEGSAVRTGDLIAVLDSETLRAQVREARSNTDFAQAKLLEALHGNRPEQIAQARALVAQADAGVEGARKALGTASLGLARLSDLKAQLVDAEARYEADIAARQQAEDALKLLVAGPRFDQVKQAEGAVTQAKAALSSAQDNATRMTRLFQQGAISAQQNVAAVSARDQAQAALDQAQAHLADLKAGARPQEVGQARMAVAQASADLEGARLGLENARQVYQDRLNPLAQKNAARAAYDSAVAQAKAARDQLALLLAGTRIEDIHAAEAQVGQARAAVTQAQSQLGDASVYAPLSGVVETKSAEAGEVMTPGAPLVTVADLDHPWLRVYVPEDQYGRLKLGQKAKVSVDSYPGQVFTGKVVEIASDAEFTPKNVQTEQERVKLVFGIKINLENKDHRLKPGMPADAVVSVD